MSSEEHDSHTLREKLWAAVSGEPEVPDRPIGEGTTHSVYLNVEDFYVIELTHQGQTYRVEEDGELELQKVDDDV